MNTIGFLIGHKENENRRALLPSDVKKCTYSNYMFFEAGYGLALGIEDKEYLEAGAVVVSREVAMKCDIVCDPKIGDAEYLKELSNQTIFGWVHAVQNKSITDTLVEKKLTAYAWEDMFENNRHVFWRNNELAGEAAVMDAFRHYGRMPYECKVALLGRGNVAQGALRLLTLLGADVTVYGRKTEELFKKELGIYDVVVNAVLWDVKRKDHIIYNEDVQRMKKNALVIDISCDRNGGIEFSVPTTISSPVYTFNGVMVYAVDHTPTLFYKTSTKDISYQVSKYVDLLIAGSENDVLNSCKITENGNILDERINQFQGR